MKLGNLSVFTAATTLILLTSCFHGCRTENQVAKIYSTNIKKVHQCYLMYMENNGYKGPKDEAEFKNYLKTDPTAIYLMKRAEITPEGVDDIFISERDGEPFKIRYGLKGVADFAIVFESVGVEGKRLVALTPPVETEAEEYDGHFSGKIKPRRDQGYGDDMVGEATAETAAE